jgi:hypothetical protein
VFRLAREERDAWVTAPATADTTLADVTLALKGVRAS